MDLTVLDAQLNATKDRTQKLKQACAGFEALFLSKVFDSMQDTVMDGGLIKKNQGEQIFTQMMHSQIAQDFTKNSSIGLADMLFDSMSKYVEADTKNTKNTQGNNFPAQEKTARTSEDFLKLRRELSGTDVASDMTGIN